MTVSVIIVVKNGELYLSEAIESVLNQTHPADEIIVVDGNSTDNTSEIARSYTGVRYVVQQGDGLANARNTGINVAKGDLIAFLDHDDYWSHDKLQAQVPLFANSPDLQYSFAQVQLFLEPGYKLRNGYTNQSLIQEQTGRTPGTLVACKSLFDKIGTFNPKFSIACDVDWFTRANDFGIRNAFVSQVLLYKRLHNGNLSGNVKANKTELFEVIKESLNRQQSQKRVV